MATKAVAKIVDFNFNGTTLFVLCKIDVFEHSESLVPLGPFDPETNSVQLNASIKAAVKAFTETTWGVVYQIQDDVRMLDSVL